MNPEILSHLIKSSQPIDWETFSPKLSPTAVSYIGKEPVYEFFYTFDETLEINTHSIGISVQPVNSFIPFHIHDYVEMTTPLLGDCMITTKDEQIALSENDIIIIGNRTPHRVNIIDADNIVINLTLKGSAFSMNDYEFLQQAGPNKSLSGLLFDLLTNRVSDEDNYAVFRTNQEPKIISTIYDIIHEYFNPQVQTNQIIRYEILTLFGRLLREAFKNSHSVRTHTKETVNLLPILLYIERHYKDLTLDKLSQHFGFNPNYLSSYLKRHTGMSFIKLVHLQRVNVAADLLSYSNAPIEKIAYEIGYENPSYFYKVFPRYFGLSPKEYRRQHRTI